MRPFVRAIGLSRHAATRPLLACVVGLTCCALLDPARAQVCGNGVLETGEDCDDGNRASLDGCSANCRFEQTQRFNQLALKTTAAPAAIGCTPSTNALGAKAITATEASALNNTIAASVADGTTSVLMYFSHGLTDPTGLGTGIRIGMFNASPQGDLTGYDGTSDLDWWYEIDESELGAAQEPVSVLAGYSIVAMSLGGGAPGRSCCEPTWPGHSRIWPCRGRNF